MKKPGPKPQATDGGALEKVTLLLDAMTLRRFRVLGSDNLSQGARVAGRVAYEQYQRGKVPQEPT